MFAALKKKRLIFILKTSPGYHPDVHIGVHHVTGIMSSKKIQKMFTV